MAHVVVITTQDGVDQTCESLGTAALEMIDLKNMGCEGLKAFVITSDFMSTNWEVAALIEDRFAAGRAFGRKGMRQFAEQFGVTIRLVGTREMMQLALAETR